MTLRSKHFSEYLKRLSDEESFTITWRIKNFNMCPQEMDRYIQSPVIRIRQLGESEWYLHLYPKGKAKEGFVSCFLACKIGGIYETVKIDFILSHFPHSSELVAAYDYELGDSFGVFKWLKVENALEGSYNSTLELKCVMKCKNPKDTKISDVAIIETLSRDSIFGKYSLNLNKCCIETFIQVQSKIVFWPIRNFQSLPLNKRITHPVYSAAIKEIPTFYVTLLKTAESTCIEIDMKKAEGISENILAICSVSVDNAPKGIECGTKDEFLFKSDAVWKLPTFLSELDDGYFKHTKGVLYLRFDFAFSTEGKMHHSVINDWDPVYLPPERQVPLDVLTTPTAEDEPSIVSLRTGDDHFKVHKSILKANSEVFSAMFENDMKEKDTGAVDILDVGPQTLGHMVAFFYSGTVGDLSAADWGNLYAAANKYQVLALIDLCSSSLLSSLTVSNVCDTLILADLYENDRLMKCAENFVIRNSDRDSILGSPNWKNLMDNHSSVAAKIMYKMLID